MCMQQAMAKKQHQEVAARAQAEAEWVLTDKRQHQEDAEPVLAKKMQLLAVMPHWFIPFPSLPNMGRQDDQRPLCPLLTWQFITLSQLLLLLPFWQ